MSHLLDQLDNQGVTLLATGDGSFTLYHPGLNETYHSKHGAVAESQHVYIDYGLAYLAKQYPEKTTYNILEVGFGTGTNVFLTQKWLKQHAAYHVALTTIDKFPLSKDLLAQVYPESLTTEELEWWQEINHAAWDQTTLLDRLTLTKMNVGLEAIKYNEVFDIVYFDAFAPRKQPNMWLPERLAQLHQALKTGGVLVTYCAQGQFKRDLKQVGFIVQSQPGPPYKLEMTQGLKP